MLAICRGLQLTNVALGGSLYQDIPTEYKTDILHRQTAPAGESTHTASVVTGTPLDTLIGKKSMTVNTFHHQAIKKLGKGLEIMASADDGIIEAVYHSDHPYLRAYQWHPEKLYDTDDNNRRIFDDFIEACCH